MEWYNGFSPQERNANGRALLVALKSGSRAQPVGKCALCGDPSAPLEYHSEDYSMPYKWSEPFAYALCRHCHRSKIHKRFEAPDLWETFKAHVRRGGYASDLGDPAVKQELERYRKGNGAIELKRIRPYTSAAGEEWWARLTTDPRSKEAWWARPHRPHPYHSII